MTHNSDARLIPFDIAHINMMDLRSGDIDEVFTMPNGVDYLCECAKLGDAFTLMHDGRIIACGGVYELWRGVAQVWLLPSAYAPQYPMVFVRTVKRMLDTIAETHKYHRIQAIISTKLQPGVRWIEMLGFTREGILRKYTPQGTDYYLYAKVK